MGLVNGISDIWDRLTGKQPNVFDAYLAKIIANAALYPDQSNETYLDSYTGNNDVFTVINKITEPASTVPIFQYDASGNKVEKGKMIARLNNPNNYQSRAQFIEAALSFYYIFGESFTAEETVDKGLNTGMPVRLDQLPPQWMTVNLGSVFNPVAGYSFYPLTYSSQTVDYTKDKIFHWKEFNPDYDMKGGHLRGMSRLRPLLRTITGSTEAYNSLVKAFQNQGMWGLVTMLDNENEAVKLTKEQISQYKSIFKRDSKKGDPTILNHKTEYTKMGLTMVELAVLQALGMLSGKLTDAFNVPDQLFSGSTSKTYTNLEEAEKALWTKAICPSLDAFLEGLTNWLAPKFREEGQVLKADYSGVDALQPSYVAALTIMISSRSFTRNELRYVIGKIIKQDYKPLLNPGMDEIFGSIGDVPLSQIGNMPDPNLAESTMKALGMSDYRLKK